MALIEMDFANANGGGTVESVDVTASTTSIPMNTGIAVLYIKSSYTPRSIAVVENGAIKWYSTVYASQPEAIDYIAF